MGAVEKVVISLVGGPRDGRTMRMSGPPMPVAWVVALDEPTINGYVPQYRYLRDGDGLTYRYDGTGPQGIR